MHWVAPAVVAGLPLLIELPLVLYGAQQPESTAFSTIFGILFVLVIAAGVFYLMATKVMVRAEYSGAHWLALLGALLFIPAGGLCVAVMMGIAVSLPDGSIKGPALLIVWPVLQLALTLPLVLGSFIGLSAGNALKLGQPLYASVQ